MLVTLFSLFLLCVLQNFVFTFILFCVRCVKCANVHFKAILFFMCCNAVQSALFLFIQRTLFNYNLQARKGLHNALKRKGGGG